MFQKYKRFATGPVGFLATAILITTTTILSWRWVISPSLKRRKREQNEAFAEYIFQERQKKLGE